MGRATSILLRRSPLTFDPSLTDLGDSRSTDEAYQEYILPLVSRTFALTIPELPAPLRSVVTTAYLLCRIADSIEDEPAIASRTKFLLLERFARSVCGQLEPHALAQEIAPLLSEQTLPAERDLVRNLDRIIRLTGSLSTRERRPIERCLRIMCRGMYHYQENASLGGLERMQDLDAYCYCVAGCVGEMLTELFCAHCEEFARNEPEVRTLAASFGQGLQMTNILKDMWEDRGRGACWLPRDVFGRYRLDVEQLPAWHGSPVFTAGLTELIGIAHAHLRNGFTFTLAVPPREAGIRRFCLLAIGMALLTLRKIHHNPGFTVGAQVKIAHTAVFATKVLTDFAVQNDWMLKVLFEQAARGLPLQPVAPRPGRVLCGSPLNDRSDIW
jgi:farnesyl-diphosphate farnesyltransferase